MTAGHWFNSVRPELAGRHGSAILDQYPFSIFQFFHVLLMVPDQSSLLSSPSFFPLSSFLVQKQLSQKKRIQEALLNGYNLEQSKTRWFQSCLFGICQLELDLQELDYKGILGPDSTLV